MREILFLDSIATERQRRLNGRVTPDPHAHVLWTRALDLQVSLAARNRLGVAQEYALGIPYRHEGLSSDIYAAHPLRVAAMALLTLASSGVDAGIVGLLHNVLEVSDVSEFELRERFGESVIAQVRSLTVDRSRQWDAGYKRAYYAAINAGPKAGRVVKVLDKLDNLFLLGLNTDVSVKTKYAHEIQKHIVPMADLNIPGLSSYIRALLKETILAEKLDLPAALTAAR